MGEVEDVTRGAEVTVGAGERDRKVEMEVRREENVERLTTVEGGGGRCLLVEGEVEGEVEDDRGNLLAFFPGEEVAEDLALIESASLEAALFPFAFCSRSFSFWRSTFASSSSLWR